MPTIDDVVQLCQEYRGLEVNDLNEDDFLGFLERQLILHKEYDLNQKTIHGLAGRPVSGFRYVNVLVDKLLFFSYFIGETPIKVNRRTKRWIGRDKSGNLKPVKDRAYDLSLITPASIKSKTDRRLYSLYARLNNNYSWLALVNELLHDKGVISYVGRRTYSDGNFSAGPRR